MSEEGVPAAQVTQALDALERRAALEHDMRASRQRFRRGMLWRLALIALVIYFCATGDMQRAVMSLWR